jgi:hypothetical protein
VEETRMTVRPLLQAPCLVAVLFVSACAGERLDPCSLLSPEEVSAIDSSVVVASWAGRGGERQEDEVCVFYTEDGDARVMLFVWYEAEAEPGELVAAGVGGQHAVIIDVPRASSRAVAALDGEELKLVGVKSPRGIVGLRVRRPVARDSADFEEVLRLAETALSRLP